MALTASSEPEIKPQISHLQLEAVDAEGRNDPATRKQREKLHFFGCTWDEGITAGQADEALGLKAYRLTVGKKPSRDDLVGIFDEGPDVIPAPVAQQKEYVDEWKRWVRSNAVQ
jgi:hypothetical protein